MSDERHELRGVWCRVHEMYEDHVLPGDATVRAALAASPELDG